MTKFFKNWSIADKQAILAIWKIQSLQNIESCSPSEKQDEKQTGVTFKSTVNIWSSHTFLVLISGSWVFFVCLIDTFFEFFRKTLRRISIVEITEKIENNAVNIVKRTLLSAFYLLRSSRTSFLMKKYTLYSSSRKWEPSIGWLSTRWRKSENYWIDFVSEDLNSKL